MQIHVQPPVEIIHQAGIIELPLLNEPMRNVARVLCKTHGDTAILSRIGTVDMRGRRIIGTLAAKVQRDQSGLPVHGARGRRRRRARHGRHLLLARQRREEHLDRGRRHLSTDFARWISRRVHVHVEPTRLECGKLCHVDSDPFGCPMRNIRNVLDESNSDSTIGAGVGVVHVRRRRVIRAACIGMRRERQRGRVDRHRKGPAGH